MQLKICNFTGLSELYVRGQAGSVLLLMPQYFKDVMSAQKFPPPQSSVWRYTQLRLTCSYANIYCTPLIYMWGASWQSNIALGGFRSCHNRRIRSVAEAQYIWAEREFCIHTQGTASGNPLSRNRIGRQSWFCVKSRNLLEVLTFWRRNYFFNFSTLCIMNVNNTGTKQVRIMKQTVF